MTAVKALVKDGRIKLDEPTDLPNGTALYVVPAAQLDEVVLLRDDGLDDDERKRLHESIRRGVADGRAGRVTEIDEFLAELEAKPRRSSSRMKPSAKPVRETRGGERTETPRDSSPRNCAY
jgi:hypothetical protein